MKKREEGRKRDGEREREKSKMTNKQLLTNFYLINLQIFIWMKNITLLYKYRRLGKEVQKYIHHTTALVHSDPGANKSP